MQGNCLGDELSWSKAVLLCTAVLLVLQNSWVHIPSSALCLPWQRCSSRRDAAIANTVLKWMNLGFIILTVSRTHYSSVGDGSHGFLSVQNKLNCACKITCKLIIKHYIIRSSCYRKQHVPEVPGSLYIGNNMFQNCL